MIEVTEVTATGRRVIVATAENFAEAKAEVEAMGVAFMEDDPDYEDCADAYLNDGRVLAIQPEGFTLYAAKKAARAKAFAKERADAARAFDDAFGIVHKGAPY